MTKTLLLNPLLSEKKACCDRQPLQTVNKLSFWQVSWSLKPWLGISSSHFGVGVPWCSNSSLAYTVNFSNSQCHVIVFLIMNNGIIRVGLKISDG